MRPPTPREGAGVFLLAWGLVAMALEYAQRHRRMDGVEAMRLDSCPSHPEGHSIEAELEQHIRHLRQQAWLN